jgi:hypothetical protein
MSGHSIGPGWYPNPYGIGKRYWDGTQWTKAVTGPSGSAPWPPGVAFAYGPPIALTETSPFAILSLAFAFIFPPLGVAFGIIGLREIKSSEGRKTGRGLAIAGIWCGVICSVLMVLWFGFIAYSILNVHDELPVLPTT